MQISAVGLGVLSSFTRGGACTTQELGLWGVGHARPGSRLEERARLVRNPLVRELGMRGPRPGSF